VASHASFEVSLLCSADHARVQQSSTFRWQPKPPTAAPCISLHREQSERKSNPSPRKRPPNDRMSRQRWMQPLPLVGALPSCACHVSALPLCASFLLKTTRNVESSVLLLSRACAFLCVECTVKSKAHDDDVCKFATKHTIPAELASHMFSKKVCLLLFPGHAT
jgi:hypothetical protein